jgi:hypothetical protein
MVDFPQQVSEARESNFLQQRLMDRFNPFYERKVLSMTEVSGRLA